MTAWQAFWAKGPFRSQELSLVTSMTMKEQGGESLNGHQLSPPRTTCPAAQPGGVTPCAAVVQALGHSGDQVGQSPSSLNRRTEDPAGRTGTRRVHAGGVGTHGDMEPRLTESAKPVRDRLGGKREEGLCMETRKEEKAGKFTEPGRPSFTQRLSPGGHLELGTKRAAVTRPDAFRELWKTAKNPKIEKSAADRRESCDDGERVGGEGRCTLRRWRGHVGQRREEEDQHPSGPGEEHAQGRGRAEPGGREGLFLSKKGERGGRRVWKEGSKRHGGPRRGR